MDGKPVVFDMDIPWHMDMSEEDYEECERCGDEKGSCPGCQDEAD